MSDYDNDIRQFDRYASGIGRFYLWVGICICYFWLVFGLIGGLLIINDGSTLFGSCVVAIGLVAWKIAGMLKRFKNGGT